MAAKKPDKAKAVAAAVEEDLNEPEPPQPSRVGGIVIGPEERKVLEGDVDSRLAALLKDHQASGARPK
jgi:hypothetical protein